MIKTSVLIFCVVLVWTQAVHIQSTSKGGRIIGGEIASTSQYPFVVALYKGTGTGNYFCTGTIINNQWIITAGQCVKDAILFNIHMGTHNLSNTDFQMVATEHSWPHPDFNENTLENDIGLVKLRMPISFTQWVHPLDEISADFLEAGTDVTTMGWGQTSDSEAGIVNDLNYVHLATLSNEECRIYYGNQIVDTMVCVGGNYNEGTCRGDLGSPLIQYVGFRIHLVGISSFISGNGCESTDPSGFTRIAPYIDWINNVTSNN